MVFKLYDCDIGITLNGVNYEFEHVDSVTIEDPVRARLTRGANASNTEGLAYMEGVKEAKTITTSVISIPAELHALLKQAFRDKTRMEVYVISRQDGSSKIAKRAILSQEPQQLTLDDSPESLNTDLIFESFDISEVHKS